MQDRPVSDGEHHAAIDDFLDGGHHAVDLRGGGDDAHADAVGIVPVRHEPVLLVREVLGAVHGLERGEALVCRYEELRGMCTALRELDEGSLGVPTEERSGVGEGEGAQEVQDFGVERPLLGLDNVSDHLDGFRQSWRSVRTMMVGTSLAHS